MASVFDGMGLSRILLAARARSLFPWRWLTVLTYHRVGDALAPGFDPDVLDASPAVFAEQVALLQRYFTLVDTRDLDAWRAGGRLPPNPAMITFDDGYRDNHDVVMPILRKHEAKAVFFVATSYINERRVFWWELVNHALTAARKDQIGLRYPHDVVLPLGSEAQRRAAIKTLLALLKREAGVDMDRFLAELYALCGLPFSRAHEARMADAMLMTWDQIRALAAAGFDVQSHSYAHRVLHTLSPEEVRTDLTRARLDLEGALDRPISSVAYPTGRPLGASPDLRQAVLDAGYRYGFTVERLIRLGRRSHDWLGIPRMMIDQAVTASFYRSTLAMPLLAY